MTSTTVSICSAAYFFINDESVSYLRFVRLSANTYSSNTGAYEIGALQVWEDDVDILTNNTTDGKIHFYDAADNFDSSMNLGSQLNILPDKDTYINSVISNVINKVLHMVIHKIIRDHSRGHE